MVEPRISAHASNEVAAARGIGQSRLILHRKLRLPAHERRGVDARPDSHDAPLGVMQRHARDSATRAAGLEDVTAETGVSPRDAAAVALQFRCDIRSFPVHTARTNAVAAPHEVNRRARHAHPDRDFGADRHQLEMARERARDPLIPLVSAVVTHALTQQATAHADAQPRRSSLAGL